MVTLVLGSVNRCRRASRLLHHCLHGAEQVRRPLVVTLCLGYIPEILQEVSDARLVAWTSRELQTLPIVPRRSGMVVPSLRCGPEHVQGGRESALVPELPPHGHAFFEQRLRPPVVALTVQQIAERCQRERR